MTHSILSLEARGDQGRRLTQTLLRARRAAAFPGRRERRIHLALSLVAWEGHQAAR